LRINALSAPAREELLVDTAAPFVSRIGSISIFSSTARSLEWSIGGFFLLEVTLVCDKDHADHCENAELEFVEHGGHGEGLNDLKKALCKIGAFVVRG